MSFSLTFRIKQNTLYKYTAARKHALTSGAGKRRLNRHISVEIYETDEVFHSHTIIHVLKMPVKPQQVQMLF